MNEPKFTKGEWIVFEKYTSPFDQDPVKNLVKMPDSQITKYGACIYAAMGGFEQATQREEIEANAHLIAAAPDMYKMLDNLQRHLAYEYLTTSLEIRELLAKARGES